MKLAEARKLFTVPTLVLLDGVLYEDTGAAVAFRNVTREEVPPKFKSVRAARGWLAAHGYIAEVA